MTQIQEKPAGRKKSSQFTTYITCEQYFHGHNFVNVEPTLNQNDKYDKGFYDITRLFQDRGQIPK